MGDGVDVKNTWAFQEDAKAHVCVQDCFQLGTRDKPLGYNILQTAAIIMPAVCHSFQAGAGVEGVLPRTDSMPSLAEQDPIAL